jgi:hexosaminidase
LVGKLGIKASTKRTSWAQLQDAFTNQLANYLSAHGRRLMVWDEAAAGEELPQQAVVLNWRAPSVGFDAARRGHDVVVASHDYLYFDYGQDSTTHWGQPALIGQGLTLQKVYGFEPAPNTLPDSVSRHIIGVQANLWTEYVCWPNLVEYQLLPRLAALAETQWTDPRKKDWSDFSARLPQLERLYDKYRWIHARR